MKRIIIILFAALTACGEPVGDPPEYGEPTGEREYICESVDFGSAYLFRQQVELSDGTKVWRSSIATCPDHLICQTTVGAYPCIEPEHACCLGVEYCDAKGTRVGCWIGSEGACTQYDSVDDPVCSDVDGPKVLDDV